jgi:septal ring factor EnvC (AmiA/AmiB activator)
MMKTTLNQLVKFSGVSRYHLLKIIADLEIEPEIEVRKNIKVQVFSDIQKQQILEVAALKKTSKTESVEADSIPKGTVEQTLLLSELSAAKARVEALLDERNYLREALSKEQETSKVLSEQMANQDQRMGVVIAALSQAQSKELPPKKDEKKSFWNRLFT